MIHVQRPECVLGGGYQPWWVTHSVGCACRVKAPHLAVHPINTGFLHLNSFCSLRTNSALIFHEFCVMLLFCVSIAAQLVRIIKTNICALVFLTMGVIAHLIGMWDRFSNKLCCRFLGKTIQNYVVNTIIIMSNDQLGFWVSNCYSVKIVNQQWLNPILIMY